MKAWKGHSLTPGKLLVAYRNTYVVGALQAQRGLECHFYSVSGQRQRIISDSREEPKVILIAAGFQRRRLQSSIPFSVLCYLGMEQVFTVSEDWYEISNHDPSMIKEARSASLHREQLENIRIFYRASFLAPENASESSIIYSDGTSCGQLQARIKSLMIPYDNMHAIYSSRFSPEKYEYITKGIERNQA